MPRNGGGGGGAGPSDFRSGMLERKAKSFEEREEEYERVKLRIFKKREADAAAAAAVAESSSPDDGATGATATAAADGSTAAQPHWPSWGGSDSSAEHDGGAQTAQRCGKPSKAGRLLKVQSLVSTERCNPIYSAQYT